MPIDVRAAGAIGDGLADDTDAIQCAIDAAFEGEDKVVFFPFGTYRVATRPVDLHEPRRRCALPVTHASYCLRLRTGVTLVGAHPDMAVLRLDACEASAARIVTDGTVGNPADPDEPWLRNAAIRRLGFDVNSYKQRVPECVNDLPAWIVGGTSACENPAPNPASVIDAAGRTRIFPYRCRAGFWWPDPVPSLEHQAAVFFSFAHDVTIEDCFFANSEGDGVYAHYRDAAHTCRRIHVVRCRFDNIARVAVNFDGANESEAFDNDVSRCGTFAFKMEDTPMDGSVADVVIRNNRVTESKGLFAGGGQGSATPVRRITLEGNSYRATVDPTEANAAINVRYFADLKIARNTVTLAHHSAVLVDAGDGLIVSNNAFRGVRRGEGAVITFARGNRPQGISNAVVRDNVLTDNQAPGIEVSGSRPDDPPDSPSRARNVVVAGNFIRGVGRPATYSCRDCWFAPGIRVLGADHVTIADNVVFNNGCVGILVTDYSAPVDVTNLTLRSNHVYDEQSNPTQRFGIALQRVTGLRAVGNNLHGMPYPWNIWWRSVLDAHFDANLPRNPDERIDMPRVGDFNNGEDVRNNCP